ncbi:lipoprotein [human gut metagenome]|uniref:Lipoprotein n=1 Tax=human gut metagenome TaxID=408170 RepID=K1UMR4_9ZZZZ
MNKKFLSAILFGALMVSSTGTFVSCKDYDEDIDRIDKELVDIKSALSSFTGKS